MHQKKSPLGSSDNNIFYNFYNNGNYELIRSAMRKRDCQEVLSKDKSNIDSQSC